MTNPQATGFQALSERVGKFLLAGKKLLIPDMTPHGSRLLAASFRAFGVHAEVMETYSGLALGKEYTSGKECFPCQITLGDILHHLQREKARHGERFDPAQYVYFLPEAEGPCRFGMYTKMQRLVLDRFPEFRDIPIVYMSTGDAYSSGSLLPDGVASKFRRLAYEATLAADVLDRIIWRTRPYEKVAGSVDQAAKTWLAQLESFIEQRGSRLDFRGLHRLLRQIAAQARQLTAPDMTMRPRIGIVGEIYLRSHPQANQELIESLEAHGAEVVNASIGEWLQFVSYEQLAAARRELANSWQLRRFGALFGQTKKWAVAAIDLKYIQVRQKKMYQTVQVVLDIAGDHSLDEIEKKLQQSGLFDPRIGTEAPLSIGGAIEYIDHGFNGVVNVYPFTCMPSTVASAVLKPLCHQLHVPYLDVSCDGSFQSGREIALRTFLHQAGQHQERQQSAPRGGCCAKGCS
ncbi:CoA activase [Chrysiogenes arsenatis]|uniref:CoA activase n=1 Tax=Chrysiogenes arsenatis TaxID=309797 RepID=UPI00040D2B6E|nr:CoA activase [Chrysiogenes arsenatis]